MRRTLLPLVAATLTAFLAVGTLAPTASAGTDRSRGGKPTSQADKRLATEQRKVVSLATSKDRALARVVRDLARRELPVGQSEVLTNVAADRVAVDVLETAALAATTVTEVRAVRAEVRAVRPEVYAVVVNGLRQAAHFQALVPENTVTISDLAAQADAKEQVEGFDVTAVRSMLADATTANDEALVLAESAIAQGVLLTARSDTAARDAFSADVAAAGERLDAVAAQLLLATEALAAMVLVAAEPVV